MLLLIYVLIHEKPVNIYFSVWAMLLFNIQPYIWHTFIENIPQNIHLRPRVNGLLAESDTNWTNRTCESDSVICKILNVWPRMISRVYTRSSLRYFMFSVTRFGTFLMTTTIQILPHFIKPKYYLLLLLSIQTRGHCAAQYLILVID